MIGFIGSRSAWKSCRDTHHKPIGTDAPTCLRRAPARRGTARTRRRTRRDDQWILRRAADGHGSKVHGDVRARASLVVRYYRGVPGMTISTTGRASAYAQDTDEVWLVLLTIAHANIAPSVRVVNNTEATTSRSNEYVDQKS